MILLLTLYATLQGFEVSEGEVSLAAGAELHDGNGDLSIAAGGAVLVAAPDSQLRVRNLSVASGGSLSAAGSIVVGGNWANTGSWTPGTSTVLFNGSGNHTISGAPAFYNLVSNGILVLLSDTEVAHVLSVPSGRLRVGNGRTLTLSSEAHTVAGTLDLDPSGTGVASLVLNGTLLVSGSLEMKREGASVGDTSYANVTGPGSINITGQLWATHFKTTGNGSFLLQNGARLVDFSEATSTWTLDLSSATAIPYSLSAAHFTGATSIKTSSTTPKLALLGGAGAALASDPSGKLSWLTGSVARLSDGAVYDTLAQAFKANEGASTIFRVKEGVRLNDSVDLNGFSLPDGGHLLENAVFAPMQPIGGTRLAVVDNSQRLKLRNVVVAKGGLQNVLVQNGTLFPMDSSSLTLAGVSQQNVVREGAQTLLVDPDNRILEIHPLTADLVYFMGRNKVDFHLRPTAQLAIDQGAAITGWLFPRDWEGEVRPIGAAWDIGADERNPEPPLPPTGVVVTPLDASAMIDWIASVSSDVTKYRVRWKKVGESWANAQEVEVEGSGYTIGGLANGTTYDVGVSAVDEAGNYSDEVQNTVTPMYPITIAGVPYPTVQAAIDAAQPGQTVELGVGTFFGDVVLKPGVSLKGYSAHHTKLVGSGTGTVVTVQGVYGTHPMSEVSHLSVTNGLKGIDGGTADLNVHHVVIHSINGPGLVASAGGRLQVVNTTIMNNAGRGIWATTEPSLTVVRNSLVGKNGGGIYVSAGSAVTYNSAWGSFLEADYAPGITGNDTQAAKFVGEGAADYREAVGSSSVDAGDPEDAFSKEPQPNGSRINRGAFGNTPWAATSAITESVTIVQVNNEANGGGSGGCGCVGLEALLLLGLLWGRRHLRSRRLGSCVEAPPTSRVSPSPRFTTSVDSFD